MNETREPKDEMDQKQQEPDEDKKRARCSASREMALQKVKPLMEWWGWTTDGNQFGQEDPETQIVVYTGVQDYAGKDVPLDTFEIVLQRLEENAEPSRPDGFAYRPLPKIEEPAAEEAYEFRIEDLTISVQECEDLVTPLMAEWGWKVEHTTFISEAYGAKGAASYMSAQDYTGITVPREVFGKILRDLHLLGETKRPMGFAYSWGRTEPEAPPDSEDAVPPFTIPPETANMMGNLFGAVSAVAPYMGGTYEVYDTTLPRVLGGIKVESGRIGENAFLEFISGGKTLRVRYPLDESYKVAKAAARTIIDEAVIGGMKNLRDYAKDPEKAAAIIPAFLHVAQQFMSEDAFNRFRETLEAVGRALSGLFAVHELPPEPSEAGEPEAGEPVLRINDYAHFFEALETVNSQSGGKVVVRRSSRLTDPLPRILWVLQTGDLVMDRAALWVVESGDAIGEKGFYTTLVTDFGAGSYTLTIVNRPGLVHSEHHFALGGGRATEPNDYTRFHNAAHRVQATGGGTVSIRKRVKMTDPFPAESLESVDLSDVVGNTSFFGELFVKYGRGFYTLTIWDCINHQDSDHHFLLGMATEQEAAQQEQTLESVGATAPCPACGVEVPVEAAMAGGDPPRFFCQNPNCPVVQFHSFEAGQEHTEQTKREEQE